MNFKALNRSVVALVLSLVPALAAADPVTLKLSFITSDRSNIFQCYIQPFVDAVNTDGAGTIQIKVYFSGARQINPMTAQSVLDGTVDMAYVVPGLRQNNFYTITSWRCPACSVTNTKAASSSPGS